MNTLQAEGWLFESESRQTDVVNTGGDSSTDERLVWVPRVLGDDHYKGTPRVTVGVAPLRIGQNSQPFTCNGDVFKWVKNSQVGRKNKQTLPHITFLNPFHVTLHGILINDVIQL